MEDARRAVMPGEPVRRVALPVLAGEEKPGMEDARVELQGDTSGEHRGHRRAAASRWRDGSGSGRHGAVRRKRGEATIQMTRPIMM